MHPAMHCVISILCQASVSSKRLTFINCDRVARVFQVDARLLLALACL